MQARTSALWQGSRYRQRMVAGTRSACSSQEFRQKCRTNMVANWQDPNYRKRGVAAVEELWRDPKWRKERTRFAKKNWENHQAAMQAGFEELQRDPKRLAKLAKRAKELGNLPEIKAKLRKSTKNLWKDPEWKRKNWESQAKHRLTLAEIKALNPGLEVRCRQWDREARFATLKLKCKACNHKWSTTWDNLRKHPNKCPKCNPHTKSASEEQAREILEHLTGWKFPRANPSDVPWLNGLTLDGFNLKHKVAFEYQGPTHYQPSHWHRDGKAAEAALAKQQRNDLRKKFQCRYHGVKLIRIPYWIVNLEAYIRDRLVKWGLI